jgi:hypothetical protein
MKKIFILITILLFWCNSGFTEESKLYLDIQKAYEETEIIKINEGYKLKCESDVEDFKFIISQKVVNSNNLKFDVVINIGQDEIFLTSNQKIKSNGELSNAKFKVHYSANFDNDLKESMKQYIGMFKQLAEQDISNFSVYGKTLKPIQIEDKAKSKKLTSLIKKIFVNDPEIKNYLKKFKMKVYENYLGTADIQSEKFYVLKTSMVAEHPDENFLENMGEMSENMHMYTLIHKTSGYGIQFESQMPKTCTIYKNNKELVKFDTSDLI